MIVRWPAGIVVPRHRHFGDVHVYTFRGRWHYKEYDWSASAGSYVFEARGATHTLVVDEDVEAMFIVNGGQVDLGDDARCFGSWMPPTCFGPTQRDSPHRAWPYPTH